MTATATAAAEALKLRETASVQAGGAVDEDGNVKMILLRPCVGRGKGSHLYTADMLRENAHKFTGWKMYIDHQSDQARRAAGGLPRPVRDLGGRVVESSWDATIPAEGRFEQGAVVGTVRPVRLVRELVEDDPEIIEASINASATAVRPQTKAGQKVWLVEGIEDHGTVDWVTEAGAGARVVSLMEAVYHDAEDEEIALLESMTDTEFAEYVRETRPGLMEALEGRAPESANHGQGAEKVDINELREALQSDDGQAVVRAAVEEQVEERTEALVEAKLAEERELIYAEAEAVASRQIRLRDMRDGAHALIEGASFPGAYADELKGRYAIRGDVPTSGLDVLDEVDDEGTVVRAAEDALREAVQSEISRTRELIASANPAAIRGQGPSGGDPEGGQPAANGADTPLWRQTLQEAGLDPDKTY